FVHQSGRAGSETRAHLGAGGRRRAAVRGPERGHRQLPEGAGTESESPRGVDQAGDRLQGQGLQRLPREGGGRAAEGDARRSGRRAGAPRAGLHVQGRRSAEGCDRRVPEVPGAAPRCGRHRHRPGRHLLHARGAAAEPVIWSVSVDLDGLGCYAAIHGLSPSLDDRALRAVPEVALQRFCELFSSAGVRATFFVIGREAGLAPSPLRNAAAEGHEIASHSYAHAYALSRRTREEIAQDLALAERAIEDASGQRPRGFRAPGYTLSAALLDAVRERGYVYDSSLLPSAPYYAAKAVAIGLYALRGRTSLSILG